MVNSTKRRGQTVTLFLLLGIVLIAVVGFMLFLRGGMEDASVEDAADLGLSTTSFKAHAHQCLRREVLNAVDKYGVIDGQGPYIGAYVRKNLPKCIEWDFYEEQGFAITAGNPEVQVEIAPDTLLVDVEYPIEGEDERGAFSFEELYYYLPRGSSGQLRFDGADRTKEEVSVSSSDGDAELIIPEGTVVKGADGNPVAEVKLHVLERDFNGLANPLIVGMVAYEITPHVTFSNPVTLKMTYREQDIPSGVAESTLRLAQFDAVSGLWMSVPTTVDSEKNTLTAKFTHFSPVAAVRNCGDNEGALFEYPVEDFPVIFQQDCGDGMQCEDATWTDDVDKDFFEQPVEVETELDIPVIEVDEEGSYYTEGDGTRHDVEKPTYQVPLRMCTIYDIDRDDTAVLTEDKIEVLKTCPGDLANKTCGSIAASITTAQMLTKCNEALIKVLGTLTADGGALSEYGKRLSAYKTEAIPESMPDRGSPDGLRDHEPRALTQSEQGAEVTGCTCGVTVNESTQGPGNYTATLGECTITKATAPTYGYPHIEDTDLAPSKLIGGFGVIRFRFAGTGGGCIALDDNGKPKVEIVVESEDDFSVKINPSTGSEGADFLRLTAADSGTQKVVNAYTQANWNAYSGEYGPGGNYYLFSGTSDFNQVYIRVENKDGGGCAAAEVKKFAIYGAGIMFDVQRNYEDCTVTVQDRINYLCRCDGDCGNSREDWGGELGILANWRGAWNPEAGSVVNGQTLLCQLDPNDGRMGELLAGNWTPYGGCCHCGPDGGMMDPLLVAEGGVCKREGLTACDYSENLRGRVLVCSAAPQAEGETGGSVWVVDGTNTCGEGQICRFVGDRARCVGEEAAPTGTCDPEKEPYRIINDETCYSCVAVSASTPAIPATVYQWSGPMDTLDSKNSCEPRGAALQICLDDDGKERECFFASCEEGWTAAALRGDDADCNRNNPGSGSGQKCCERSTCPEGYTPDSTGTCISEGCSNINSCTGYDTADFTTFTGVEDNKGLCLADPCRISGGCTLVGGSCFPTGTECLPGIPQEWLPPGTPEQKYWRPGGIDGQCYECVVPAWAPADEYQWKKTTRGECACAGGVNVGDTAWSANEGCRRCDGVDHWTQVEVDNNYNCPDKMCVTLQPSRGYFVAPDQAVCLGDTGGGVYHYAECHVDAQGEPQVTIRACGMGCTVRERKTPSEFAEACDCQESACNTCFPSGLIQMSGREGEYVLTQNGNCYVCHGQAGRNWDVAVGCTCSYETEETVYNVAIGLYDWDKVNKVCRKCVADTSDPQTTSAYWKTSGVSTKQCGTPAMCLTHQSVSVPDGGIWYNELLCIASPPNSRVQECLGNGEWGEEASCDYGCEAGMQVDSTPLAWCDPANH